MENEILILSGEGLNDTFEVYSVRPSAKVCGAVIAKMFADYGRIEMLEELLDVAA
ncbi:MAG: hypothetical protein JXK05_09685 [Campylobacterales bacterium]|nr:hypothetical protein [Campylobacterales bacterium]